MWERVAISSLGHPQLLDSLNADGSIENAYMHNTIAAPAAEGRG
jgi:hypothetical protein